MNQAPRYDSADLSTFSSNKSRRADLGATQIGFLFNHESVHQIDHSAPIIAELVRRYPAIRVTVLASSSDQLENVRRIIGTYQTGQCRLVKLEMSKFYSLLERAAGTVGPFKRYAILKNNLNVFRQLDALVVPEQTSLLLRDWFGLDKLKLIYTHHGAGDRSVGFRPATGRFDFVLLSGPKLRDRLSSLGYIREGGYKIIGYPKFDAIAEKAAKPPRLFVNDNPTVLYNPHFEPRLSSWYKMGRDILEFFYERPEYNLIFAPHVMLFKRKVHASLEHRRARFLRTLPEKYRQCDHILVDTGSSSSVDMTYTQLADIYLGDVSSQIYEFLVKPRPCVFLNAHGAAWEDNPDYLHWQCGPVLSDLATLEACLSEAERSQPKYQGIQKQLFDYTFDIGESGSAGRAADAITEFVLAPDG